MKIFSALCLSALLLASCENPRYMLLHPDNIAFKKQAPPEYQVLLTTTKGDILMEVRREWSPNGADRFYHLVRLGYFNNAAVFRISKGTWAQFGVASDPKVAQAWRHQNIPDDPRVLPNLRGTVDYAFKDPNGRTTQMFINLKDNRSTHDAEPFVPFAKVISGMEVADSLYNGYGEKSGGGIRGGKQDSLFAEGNAWLTRNFPKLDYIKKARIIKKHT
ncbi:MAG: peptidylprolyl isomerase [Bacteroidetes bacterium]|nr:peptidylprolyl isomerase [Bacteroidota bacterium]